MMERWDIKSREIHMDNSQKSQLWHNGIAIGEVWRDRESLEQLFLDSKRCKELEGKIQEIKECIKIGIDTGIDDWLEKALDI